jgi:hypothetical protein
MFPFMQVHVNQMNFIKNQIISKFQSVEILHQKDARERIPFFLPFGNFLYLLGS